MLTLNYSKKYFRFLLAFLLAANLIYAASPDPVRSRNGMVVSADELASKVGLMILKKGGNAIDAAVATGFALAVTYPYAGNIGGGGFMVIHLKDGKNITIDYREKAPLKAFKDMYLDSSGNYLPELSSEGISSVGVPGSVAGLIYALEHYGTMKLSEVIQPAINLAEDGFALNYRTAGSIRGYLSEFEKYSSSIKIFSKNGDAYTEGEIFKQKDLAGTLKRIKKDGRDGFYKGKTAELLLEEEKKLGGYITMEDLEKYQPVERIPVTGNYRGYKIISMPPPSSGGIALVELLNILENNKYSESDWNSSAYIHQLSEAMKYVYADRSVYLGDPDFTEIPQDKLTSKEYAKQIFSAIADTATPSSQITAGNSFSFKESTETTHYSVLDKEGNAVSTTTTINSGYGSKIVVEGAGFLLNNEMDDFSSKPGVPNQYGLIGNEANSIQPEKRMLSSMTPTIVLKNDKPFLIIGSPGGSTIITVVLQVVMNCIDFGMDIQEAISAPRIHHQWLPDKIDYEKFGLAKDVILNLEKLGYTIGNRRTLGRAEGIMYDQKKAIMYGAADPRGYGTAEGY